MSTEILQNARAFRCHELTHQTRVKIFSKKQHLTPFVPRKSRQWFTGKKFVLPEGGIRKFNPLILQRSRKLLNIPSSNIPTLASPPKGRMAPRSRGGAAGGGGLEGPFLTWSNNHSEDGGPTCQDAVCEVPTFSTAGDPPGLGYSGKQTRMILQPTVLPILIMT